MVTDKSDLEVRTSSGTRLRPKRTLDADTSLEARIRRARQRAAGDPDTALDDSVPPAPSRSTVRAVPAPVTRPPTRPRQRPASGFDRPASTTASRPVPTELPTALAEIDLYTESGKRQALRAVEELKDRFEGRPHYEVRLHWFRFLCGVERGDVAAKAIQEAAAGYHEDDPDRGHAEFLLGRIELNQDELEAALVRFDKALDLAPQHGGARMELAKTTQLLNARRLSDNSEQNPEAGSSWFARIFNRG